VVDREPGNGDRSDGEREDALHDVATLDELLSPDPAAEA